MDQQKAARRAPEFTLEVSADRSSVKDVVKATLHLIFFHRYFPPLSPATHEVLDLTLPYISDSEVAAYIADKTAALVRQFDSNTTQQPPVPSTTTSTVPFASAASAAGTHGTLVVTFLSPKRSTRKTWFASKSTDESTPFETWVLQIVLTAARTEAEAARNKRAMEKSLQRAAMKVIAVANRERAHIPPITTNETNPFPYRVVVKNREEGGWGKGMGIF